MSQTQKTKDVTIGDRTFRIKKFDAKTGGFVLIKLAGVLAPLMEKLGGINKFKDVQNPTDVNLEDFDLPGFMSAIGSIPENDYNYLQDKSLRVCSELLQAGSTPVLNADGSFGVIGIEDDAVTVLALTAHALIFNVQSFFSASPLGSMGGLLTMFRQGS